jgi:hypothetical protein
MDPATHAQRKASPPDPEVVARTVNSRMAAASSVARYRAYEARPRDRVDDLERQVEAMAALLYELQARIDLPF